jgi:hypothetical protein
MQDYADTLTVVRFDHYLKIGDEVQLKLNSARYRAADTTYDSPVMLVNAFHTETNEPQCVWLGTNLQPYVAYFNPEILAHAHPSH